MRHPRQEAIQRLDAIRHSTQPAFGSHIVTSLGVGDDRSGLFWRVHDDRVIDAVKIALVTGRPLLIEGPSGTGKSSLAHAVANTLEMSYLEVTIDSRLIARDLLYEVDVVQRLHDAQIAGQGNRDANLELSAYVRPGPLWWAFDPVSANERPLGRGNDLRTRSSSVDPTAPTVVLIDEIDKADPDVPNNLLVPIGSSRFHVPELRSFVEVRGDATPLVIMTTNAERDLPPAFLRRCVQIELHYASPADLVEIGAAHLPADRSSTSMPAEELLSALVETLLPGVDARSTNPSDNSYLSPAEFVDGVRAMAALNPASIDDPIWQHLRSILTGRDGDD